MRIGNKDIWVITVERLVEAIYVCASSLREADKCTDTVYILNRGTTDTKGVITKKKAEKH